MASLTRSRNTTFQRNSRESDSDDRASNLEMRSLISIIIAALALAIGAFSQTQTRSLSIKTEPSAIVWLNNLRYGVTDEKGVLELKRAPVGRQALRVRANGFREATKVILPTQNGQIDVPLTKTTDAAELAFQEAERLSLLDRAKAIEAYRNAIKLKPANVEAHVGMARMMSDSGDFEGAEKAIRQAAKLNPRHAEASAVAGRIQKLSGDEAKAIAAFKRAITNGGGFQPEAFTGLGILYQERAEEAAANSDAASEPKNYAESAKNFAIAVKQLGTSPDAAAIIQLLGLVYEQQKKYNEAIVLYQDFLRLFPDSAEATAVQSFIVQLKKQMAEQ